MSDTKPTGEHREAADRAALEAHRSHCLALGKCEATRDIVERALEAAVRKLGEVHAQAVIDHLRVCQPERAGFDTERKAWAEVADEAANAIGCLMSYVCEGKQPDSDYRKIIGGVHAKLSAYTEVQS